MSWLPRLALGAALAGFINLAAGFAMADEETGSVMARHPLYPVVAAILTLHTGKDIDSLSNEDMADAVGGIIADYPELGFPVVAAIAHGAMALRPEAGKAILAAAVAAYMSLAAEDATMPLSATPDSSEEETVENKGTGTMRRASGEEENEKGYHPSRRSEIYEQVFEKMMSRYAAWTTLDDAARAALLASGRQIESGAHQADATVQQAYAELAAAMQQSNASTAQQLNSFFAEVRRMVSSVMRSEMTLARKTRLSSPFAGLPQDFLVLRREASPQ